MSVPTPTDYDADRLAAFNHVNEIRLSAGLGMLASNTMMDQAAQAHANWLIANNNFSHQETINSPGFTGVNWWDRDSAVGYKVLLGDEVMSWGDQPVSSVDGLVNVLYHRAGILEVSLVDVGIGYAKSSNQSVPLSFVMDMSVPNDNTVRSYGQSLQGANDGMVIWPLDGAVGVPTLMGNEIPNPIPDIEVTTLGTPASISVDDRQEIKSNQLTMTNLTTGDVVESVYLDQTTDPNKILPKSFIGVVPKQRLAPNTSYQVQFSGFVNGQPRTKVWRFSTGSI